MRASGGIAYRQSALTFCTALIVHSRLPSNEFEMDFEKTFL